MVFSDFPIDLTNQIVIWARQAGQIALRYFNRVEPQQKPDQSFVTLADLEIEHFLTEHLRRARPDWGLIGEEEGYRPNQFSSAYLWTIDPLDGTTAFVQGLPGWGISIGLLYQGQPCFGLFYMPLLNDLTYTTGRSSIYCNGYLLEQTVRSEWDRQGFLAVSATTHQDFDLKIRRTQTMGSVGANLIYTARGAATTAFIPRARLWDLVAPAAILIRAGGDLQYLSGQPIDYWQLLNGQPAPEPIIAGHPDLLAELQNAIQPR